MLIGNLSTPLPGASGAAHGLSMTSAQDVRVAGQGNSAAGAMRVTLERAVADVNRALAESSRELAFSVDEASGKTVIRVVEPATGRVVRQIPSPELLVLAARLGCDGNLSSLGVDRCA